MTEKRQAAALQRGSGDSMAIGEFGGAATLSDESGALLSTPMYWFYEIGHAALNPARAFAHALRQVGRGNNGTFRALDATLPQTGMGHRFNNRWWREGLGQHQKCLGAS